MTNKSGSGLAPAKTRGGVGGSGSGLIIISRYMLTGTSRHIYRFGRFGSRP